MLKRGFFTVTLLLIVYSASHAQLNYADRLYEENSFEDAAVLYERVYKKDTNDLYVIQRLGHCYQKLNKYEAAEEYFGKAVKFENAEPESHLHYGQLLKNQNKIKQARNQFEIFLKQKPESLLGRILLQSCDAIGEWTAIPTEFQLSNLEAVNTEFVEIAPFPVTSGLTFTSDKNYIVKGEGEDKVKKSLDGTTFSIYLYDSNLTDRPIRSFSDDINSIDNSEGPGYLSKDGSLLYYSKVFSRQRLLVNQIEIHIAKLEGEKWVRGEAFKYNNKNYSVSNPVVSFDGSTFYFASDMPGGMGGMDIYLSRHSEKGFEVPVNIGEPVNSSGDEIPSFIDEAGTLYFSSNFHPGFGGMDAFKSFNDAGKWSVPENLKTPFNSTKDELGFILTDSINGFFSSNRDGGKGLDDIYFFTKHHFTDSAYYTDISGLFLFDTLPMMNMSLALLDENDEIIQTVVTNEKGEFSFKNVPVNVPYKILINEEPDKVPEEAKIYLTDENYRKIMLIERLKKGLFTFDALPRDQYVGLSLMDEVDDNGFPLHGLTGQLTSKNETKNLDQRIVYLVDEEGNVVASTVTNHLGKFSFEKLTVDNQYLFKLEEFDPEIDIKIINAKGEIIGRTIKNKDGLYVYHKFTINPSGNPDVRGVFKFGNLPADGISLFLLNENDEVLMVTKTNIKGEFEFKGLNDATVYKIQADTAVKIPGNATMFIMDKYTGMLMPVSKLSRGTFRFETLAPLPAEELALMEEVDYIIKPRVDIKGHLYSTENKTVPTGIEIQVMDEAGKVVAVTKVNEKGIFKFFNLPTEDQYLFNIPEDDSSYAIRIINNDGRVIGETRKNDKNLYVYHKFTINPSDKPDIRGLFKYGNLPANGVSLKLLDENDQTLQVTETDVNGEFSFKQLSAGKIYRIQADESGGEVPADASMYVLDEYTGLMLPVSRLSNGRFEFETLSQMSPEELALMEENDDSAIRFSFFAMLFSKLPMDLPEGLEVYIVDDNGAIIGTARVDHLGQFKYEKLPMQDEYLLKISEDNPNYELKIISKEGNLVGILVRNAKGEFVFNRHTIGSQQASTSPASSTLGEIEANKDNSALTSAPISGHYKPYINFAFGGTYLTNDVKKNLDLLITNMSSDKALKLELLCHTDSRGPSEFNLQLSALRGKAVKNYLSAKGIDPARVKISSFGESKLLNECSDEVNCSPEKHAENRRVELKYLQ